MKIIKSLSALFIAFALVAVVGVKAVAATAPLMQVGIVQGLVSKPDGNAAVGASVNVVCFGSSTATTTDSSGFYFVQFPNGACTAGQTVNVSATLGGLNGNNTGTMTNQGYSSILELDVAIVHVPMVPEFGLITGAIALVTSAGSMIFLRRKI